MAYQLFTEAQKQQLNEQVINDAYALYLHKFVDESAPSFLGIPFGIMHYDEFKEYYLLKVLGRSAEFTQNMARDYQFMTFDNFAGMLGN